MKVLVVDSDVDVRETVALAFAMRWPGSSVLVAGTTAAALDLVQSEGADLVIAERDLPDRNGCTVVEAVRRLSEVPMIVLSAQSSASDVVRGLEAGADDYLGKPFSPFELLARAGAVLRRTRRDAKIESGGVLRAGAIVVNQDTAETTVGERLVRLSPTEFKLLTILVRNAGKVVSRDILMRDIWGEDASPADAYLVKLHVQHLRRKLGDDGLHPRIIHTVRGFGYKVAN